VHIEATCENSDRPRARDRQAFVIL